ncbi:MAG: IS66 family insertion sequence element accessory protein TnpB [Pseudomonas sp.]|uniref:IS66 family insertion sequence element accessory protein TnpB n=1 Tax=Pseudomonas sp. TaxID=306 RepID=UPI00391C2ED5
MLPIHPGEPVRHDATRRKSRKVYLYPKPVDFRKSIDGLAALVERDITVAVFDPKHRPTLGTKRLS